MKITKVSCSQFAGISACDTDIKDGLNVIFGKNESGKSTIINLISRILFQPVKIDNRSDKNFVSMYFPASKKDGKSLSDFIDGKIVFETDEGKYILEKSWGEGYGCILMTPDGAVKNEKVINDILKKVFKYGEGVYSDMLLSSQHSTDESLKKLLDMSGNETKEEIVDVLSQAFSMGDGISPDKIEEKINKKIAETEGAHWDYENNCPVRKSGKGKWATGLGKILQAYYAHEDAVDISEKITALETSVDNANIKLKDKEKALQSSKDELDSFTKIESQLILKKGYIDNKNNLSRELKKSKDALKLWPLYEEEKSKAFKLDNENKNRCIIDKYNEAKKFYDRIKEAEQNIEGKIAPSKEEISVVKNAEKKISSLQNKLCGMNINAAIKMFEGHTVEITSLRTGEKLDASSGMINLTEAVKLCVPGVIEMQLAPANADVQEIERKISENKKVITGIYEKFGVKSIEELERLAEDISDIKNEIENCRIKLKSILGSADFEELEISRNSITGEVRSKEEIEKDITELCGHGDIQKFHTEKETLINNFIKEYGSVEQLKMKVSDIQEEMDRIEKAISDSENIPDKYKSIENPEAYKKMLMEKADTSEKIYNDALIEKTKAESDLESANESLDYDPKENVEKTLREFNEQKELLDRWKHISEVFRALKNEIHNNPLKDIGESFLKYLICISSGNISSEFPEEGKLNMNIYTKDRHVNYDQLSEGTKETVSLAFRLAVIDHLFPDGGGFAVFDDPVADMDKERAEQSCKLLKMCAEKHQIIILTCHERYRDMLNGNLISL